MLAVIGVSHRDVPLTDVQRLADAAVLPGALDALCAGPDATLRGVAVLSTCNRFEIYLDAARFHDAIDAVVAIAADAIGAPAERTSQLLSVRTGPSVAEHLFRVAAGLESMVVGEAEISGQVAAALALAQDRGTASSALNLLFQSAAHCAKSVATETDLGAAGRSIAGVALAAAEAEVGPLSRATVLMIGTGSYARVIAATLKSRGCADVSVYSASGRQAEFAAGRGLGVVDDDALIDALIGCDIVVTASGLGAVVLDAERMQRVLRDRRRPLCVVDLALRQDVPPDTRQLPGIRMIDLNHAAAGRSGGRDPAAEAGRAAGMESPAATEPAAEAVSRAENLVSEAVDDFVEEVAARRLDPAVVALRNYVTETIERELGSLHGRLSPDVAAEVDRSMHRIGRALLHTPSIRARMLARDGHGARYVDALHTLFGIEAPSTDDAASGAADVGNDGMPGDPAGAASSPARGRVTPSRATGAAHR